VPASSASGVALPLPPPFMMPALRSLVPVTRLWQQILTALSSASRLAGGTPGWRAWIAGGRGEVGSWAVGQGTQQLRRILVGLPGAVQQLL
jgi:hypothetical protein